MAAAFSFLNISPVCMIATVPFVGMKGNFSSLYSVGAASDAEMSP